MSIALLALALVAAPPLHDLDALREQVARFAGGVALVDARLALSPCPAPQIAWADGGASAVTVTCAAPAWRVFVAVQGATPAARPAPASRAPVLVRRGDAVSVSAGGPGFSVAVAGVAENDAAAGGRVRVRNRSSGGIVLALVSADGQLSAASAR